MIRQSLPLPTEAKEILTRLQQQGESYLSGGGPRDLLIGKTPHDYDFVTTLSMEELEHLFPRFQTTEGGREFGVGRFQWKGIQMEITSRAAVNNWFSAYLRHKDFTINSFYHDGTYIYGSPESFSDLQSKHLHFQEHPSLHINTNPQSLIRAVRLSGELDLIWSDELLAFYTQHTSIWHSLTVHRLQQEGLRILYAPFAGVSLRYLQTLGILPDHPISWHSALEGCTIPVALALLSYRTSTKLTDAFMEQFHLGKWKEPYNIFWEQLRPILPCLINPSLPIPNFYSSFSFRTHGTSIQYILSFLKHAISNQETYNLLRGSLIKHIQK